MQSYFFFSSSLDFGLLPPNSISHFHPSLLLCLSFNLLYLPKLLTRTTIHSQAPYPNLLPLPSQTLPAFFRFLVQSLCLSYRGGTAAEARRVRGGEFPRILPGDPSSSRSVGLGPSRCTGDIHRRELRHPYPPEPLLRACKEPFFKGL